MTFSVINITEIKKILIVYQSDTFYRPKVFRNPYPWRRNRTRGKNW
jgi:hypothetical protein